MTKFQDPMDFKKSSLNKDQLLFQTLPRLVLDFLEKYFRLKVEGLEHIPKNGKALVVPNHSGYSGFDVFLLSHVLKKYRRRMPRILTHRFWFFTDFTAKSAQKLGFINATYENGKAYLNKNSLVVLFPEGENGNFKPTQKNISCKNLSVALFAWP
ncbi:MAG: 1-acyl-sn-glycerol-3-phosphate acyltransferase [Pseudobdellovibrionaceae bacterium]